MKIDDPYVHVLDIPCGCDEEPPCEWCGRTPRTIHFINEEGQFDTYWECIPCDSRWWP